MKTDTGPVVGAIITFTTSDEKIVGTRPPTAVTDNDGSYFAVAGGKKGTTITAHYAVTSSLVLEERSLSKTGYVKPDKNVVVLKTSIYARKECGSEINCLEV